MKQISPALYITISVFLLLFSLIGFFTVMNLAHEYTHYKDMGKYSSEKSICLLKLNESSTILTPIISYDYKSNTSLTNVEYQKAMSSTETHAYTISILVFIFYFTILMLYIAYTSFY